MEERDRRLVLEDLCGRVLHGVICKVSVRDYEIDDSKLSSVHLNGTVCFGFVCVDVDKVKPYLRPMSSMTKEEEKEYYELYYDAPQFKNGWRDTRYLEGLHVDWFNRNHFDYRGLIGKGLAIEVTEDNNPYKVGG